MDKKCINCTMINRAQLIRLASRGVNANSSNANFGPGAVNTEDGMTNANSGNNLFNSDDGNENDDGLAVRPVDSINCGYIIIDYVRDNIETNYCPFVLIKTINLKQINLFVSNST